MKGFSRKNCIWALSGSVATYRSSRISALNETGLQEGDRMSAVDSKLYSVQPVLNGQATETFAPTVVMDSWGSGIASLEKLCKFLKPVPSVLTANTVPLFESPP